MKEQISDRTLKAMDKAMENYKAGRVSKPIDIQGELEEINSAKEKRECAQEEAL